MSICSRIMATLEQKKITQWNVAKELGVAKSTFRDWLNRDDEFPVKYLVPISNVLGVHPFWLLTGENPPAGIPDDYVQLSEENRFVVDSLNTLDFEGRVVVTNKIIEEKRRIESEAKKNSTEVE